MKFIYRLAITALLFVSMGVVAGVTGATVDTWSATVRIGANPTTEGWHWMVVERETISPRAAGFARTKWGAKGRCLAFHVDAMSNVPVKLLRTMILLGPVAVGIGTVSAISVMAIWPPPITPAQITGKHFPGICAGAALVASYGGTVVNDTLTLSCAGAERLDRTLPECEQYDACYTGSSFGLPTH